MADEDLVLSISADTRQILRALNRLQTETNKTTANIEKQFNKTGDRLGRSFDGLGRKLAGAFALAGGIRGLQSLLDSATKIDNALKVAGLSGEELERVYNRLRDSAVRNAAPLETLVQLYSRASMAAGNLGASQDDLIKFSDNVAMSLKVSGQSATEASGALLQLSQLLSGSVVQAQEYNSLIDGAYPLLQAVAAGLKEAGGDVGKLTALVKSGQVPTKAFFDAFQAGAYVLEEKVAGAALTTSQSLENVRTAALDAMRDFARGSTGADTLAEAFQMLEGVINAINFEEFGAEVRKVIGWIDDIKNALRFVQGLGPSIGAATGLDRVGEWLTGGKGQVDFLGGSLGIQSTRALQGRIDAAFGNAVDAAGSATEAAIQAWVQRNYVNLPATAPVPGTKPSEVSLGSYDPPKGEGKGSKGRGAREDSYQREIRQIQERTAALQAETAAMSLLNPLVNDYGYSLEKTRATQELLTAAQRAGLEITPELMAQIEALASGYADAEVAAAKLQEQQEAIVEASDFVKDALGDMVMDMVPAIETGNSALDKFLNTLIEAVAQATLLGKGPLAGIFGMAGGGLFGGGFLIPGILHSGGVAGVHGYGHGRAVSPAAFAGAQRYHTGGIAGLRPDEVPAILQRGEIVLPRGTQMGGGQSFNMPITINAPGADAAALARVERSVKDLAGSIPKQVAVTQQKMQTRKWRP